MALPYPKEGMRLGWVLFAVVCVATTTPCTDAALCDARCRERRRKRAAEQQRVVHQQPLPEGRGSNNVFLQAWDGAQRGEGTVRALFAGVVGVLFVGAVHGIWHELHRTDRREFGAPPEEQPKGGGSGGGGAFAGEDAESRVLGLRNLVDLRRALGGGGGDPRPRCWFGEQCYRKNPRHKAAFAHPGERDWFSCASVPRVRLRLIGLGPPFLDRFATVLDRFSGSWCRFLESWR